MQTISAPTNTKLEGMIVYSAVKAGRLSLNHSEKPVPTPTKPPQDDGLVIEY